MNLWRAVATIVAKDVAAELRSREILSTWLIFALMIVVIFNFAFELRVDNVNQIAPGVLWVAFAFSGVLALDRSFLLERENDCVDGLMLAPISPGTIFVGKALGNILFMSTAEAFILPVFAILFDVPIVNPMLWLIVLLGTIGFAMVGTLFAAMLINTRARQAMLPLLLFPVIVPVLIAATKSSALVLDGQPMTYVFPWLRLLLGFDVILGTAAFLGFEYVLEE